MKKVMWKREGSPLTRWGSDPCKGNHPGQSLEETENGDNTVNTSPEAERGVGRYLETRTSIAWMPLFKTPPLPCRDFYLLLGFLSPGLPHRPRVVVICLGCQATVLNEI